MVKSVLFDTVILIDFIRGIPQAKTEIDRYEDGAISHITWMEVMAGATAGTESATASFLSTFTILPITHTVAERAVALRRNLRLKLPDAIIFATAQLEGRTLVTRNTRDFTDDGVTVIVPYKV